MKTTFLPLLLGLAMWFGLAVMVGVTFERAPAPQVQKPAPRPPPVRTAAPVIAEL
jgi:hypothetical protein